jgi:RNA polymerase sigma-70 factor (ECF subfamily)
MQMSDDELIRLLREDPEKGCEVLLRQYTPLVLSIARRRLSGCCTAEDIEEITADILFKCFQQRDKLSCADGSIRAYLATLTVRRCIDHYRSIANKPVSEPVEPLAEHLADSAQTPDEQYVTDERKRRLMDAVKALGEPDTEIILRKYYQNETAAEIAAALGMNTGAVEMRLTRARKKLKEMLGGDEA